MQCLAWVPGLVHKNKPTGRSKVRYGLKQYIFFVILVEFGFFLFVSLKGTDFRQYSAQVSSQKRSKVKYGLIKYIFFVILVKSGFFFCKFKRDRFHAIFRLGQFTKTQQSQIWAKKVHFLCNSSQVWLLFICKLKRDRFHAIFSLCLLYTSPSPRDS